MRPQLASSAPTSIRAARRALLRRRSHPVARFVMATGRTLHLIGLILACGAGFASCKLLSDESSFPWWLRWLVAFLATIVVVYPFYEAQAALSRRLYPILVRYATKESVPQPFLLYFRAFLADQFVKPDVFVGEFSFEEELAYALAPYGTLCGIVGPNAMFPPLGVVWIRLTNGADWKDSVQDLAQRATLIVVQADASSGLRWELENILPLIGRERLLIMLPQPQRYAALQRFATLSESEKRSKAGFRDRDPEKRYESFRAAAGFLALPAYSQVSDALALRFRGGEFVKLAENPLPPESFKGKRASVAYELRLAVLKDYERGGTWRDH